MLWRASLVVRERDVPAAERVLESWAEAVSVFERDPSAAAARGPQPGRWADDIGLIGMCVVEGISAAAPDLSRLSAVAAEHGMPVPEVAALGDRDWLAENRRDFPTLRIGGIAVRSAESGPARAPIVLTVDAGAAFGTGRHATTAGCLEVLDRLGRKVRARRVLDIGTGTGILALASARIWPEATVVAGDIDPMAVAAARANARCNRITLSAIRADGLRNRALLAYAPYGIVLANILYRPLLRLAPALVRVLEPGGHLVLSGILDWQSKPLRLRLRAAGLRTEAVLSREGWSTLVLRRRRTGTRATGRYRPCR